MSVDAVIHDCSDSMYENSCFNRCIPRSVAEKRFGASDFLHLGSNRLTLLKTTALNQSYKLEVNWLEGFKTRV